MYKLSGNKIETTSFNNIDKLLKYVKEVFGENVAVSVQKWDETLERKHITEFYLDEDNGLVVNKLFNS